MILSFLKDPALSTLVGISRRSQQLFPHLRRFSSFEARVLPISSIDALVLLVLFSSFFCVLFCPFSLPTFCQTNKPLHTNGRPRTMLGACEDGDQQPGLTPKQSVYVPQHWQLQQCVDMPVTHVWHPSARKHPSLTLVEQKKQPLLPPKSPTTGSAVPHGPPHVRPVANASRTA